MLTIDTHYLHRKCHYIQNMFERMLDRWLPWSCNCFSPWEYYTRSTWLFFIFRPTAFTRDESAYILLSTMTLKNIKIFAFWWLLSRNCSIWVRINEANKECQRNRIFVTRIFFPKMFCKKFCKHFWYEFGILRSFQSRKIIVFRIDIFE